ncbi:hypothetical protein YSA_08834 [Pseudomonas putida ND6]|uniref:Uncharacterized protein n=1 Tax=Pseudomonas putida ND6 TaxID=231023 RepID=I3V1C8_PSEPU|nr:hypothetical protein YSA_08834 [Pseudomonas putida ND6]
MKGVALLGQFCKWCAKSTFEFFYGKQLYPICLQRMWGLL